MRISTKGRYGLAAMTILAQKDVYHTAPDISNRLGFSKIYMEQVFALLKKAGLVDSQKGSLGGYALSKPSKAISVYEVLRATETSIFEPTQSSVKNSNASHIESVLSARVWRPIDAALKNLLGSITLDELAYSSDGAMFYI